MPWSRIGAFSAPTSSLESAVAATMLRPTYPIRTERLLLRPFEIDDLDARHAYESRTDVARYLYWHPRDRTDCAEKLKASLDMTTIEREGDALKIAVTLSDSGTLVGDVNIEWLSRENGSAEIGYIFHPDYHGRGYASEAAAELLRLGFDELGVHRIIGRCEARNTASAQVLRKLGMRQEAHLLENEFVKGEWQSELIFAILDREWRAR